MGYQRGTQNRVKTSDHQPEPSTQSQHRDNHSVEAMQEMLGSRAASRQLRASEGGAHAVQQMARSLSPVSPRVQAKPLFRGVSQEWGMAPATGLVIQPKLTIGAPNDRYEQEADRVAQQVVQRLHTSDGVKSQAEAVIQREKMPDEEDKLQMKPMSFHREAIGGGEASPDLTSAINRARGKGQTLDASLQATMGQAMGADFSGVRIHTDAQSDQLNRQIASKAFTTRQDVFFRRGAYQPGSQEGQKLIAHELTHVAQQTDEVKMFQDQVSQEPQSKRIQMQKNQTSDTLIQRKFGFELEVPMPITTGVDQGTATEPKPLGTFPRVANAPGKHFYVNIDHSGTLNNLIKKEHPARQMTTSEGSVLSDVPIMEFVTEAMDESVLTENDVADRMQEMVDTANAIVRATNNHEERVLLNGIGNLVADPSVYIGWETTPFFKRMMGFDAYVQQTYGVSLKAIPKEFKQRADQKGSKITDDNKQVLRNSDAIAQTLIDFLFAKYHGKYQHSEKTKASGASKKEWRFFGNTFNITNRGQLTELKGLFALIVYYIKMGQINPHVVELIKKKVGLFYFKTKLSTVRNNIANNDADIRDVLQNRRGKIVRKILELTQKPGNEEIVSGSNVRADVWIIEVLSGTRDRLFEGSVNPYSNELTADNLGANTYQGTGVVLENRHFAETEGKLLGRKPPNEWVQMGKDLYNYLTNLQS